MATPYKCPNIGNCEKANQAEVISILTGSPSNCPECGANLILAKGAVSSRNNSAILAGIVLGMLLLAAGVWFYFSQGDTAADNPALPMAATPATAPDPLPAPPAQPPAPTAPVANTFLRFHGSNTIGGKLLPALATAFFQQQGYSNIHKVNSAQADEVFIAGELNGHGEQIEIQYRGSETAFSDLLDGRCDIGMSSRKIKPEERQKLLPTLGDLSSNASEHVIALDGVALIVNSANPVKTLSLAQAADIFSGKLAGWPQLGGGQGAIDIYARDEKSGTYDFFNESVLKARGKTLAANAQRFEDSAQLSAAVAANPAGIGFIGLNYIGSNKAVALSDTGIEPRKPSLLTIKTEDYILSRRLYLYTAENPPNPHIRQFIEFAASDAAQAVIAANGLVNLDVTPMAAETDDARSKSAKWRGLTKDAAEIPTRFRFRTGNDELDSRANRDIGRIVFLLSHPPYQGKQVILIGFADASGSPKVNLELSKSRAVLVKEALAQEGVNVQILEGLGADAFVAPNDSDEHKEKNRRVEIWVK